MLFEKVKTALRISTTALDGEIRDLIDAALADLGIAGVHGSESDFLIVRAAITYCRANFGQPEDYERLKASYDEQKAQLQMATDYTDWGDLGDGEGACYDVL
mgnify:CR=1 FL=1